MDKSTINISKSTAYSIIYDMHDTLKKHGIADNHIALFGSFYNGNHHNNSDIDIIIVSDKFEGKNMFERLNMTYKAESEVRKRFVVPMDILFKTPKEYEYSKQALFDSEIVV